ncbi:hypothetical protein M2323_001654 [Rhodoblastus acidophilus]|uniref:hypothetical protein n=1 Tax=Rhodoblastus acidophilus TaxID=1074 RepID=UPI002225AED8|nr:hypothetical protein [Rhodoblastus acidophilus]MCW2284041.1 hypothetical protein [Rhodoblastus acidophilus]MCW2332737.1 hypothetical protein [Rhodoblastus acidophilus]
MIRLLSGLLLVCAALAPVRAHHVRPQSGGPVGVEIPAVSHGATPILARYLPDIQKLAERRATTDPTLRRLQNFVSLQYFACGRGLAPGSLTDEDSPFNECAHAYVAGARALLDHLAALPSGQDAQALQARIAEDIARDPGAGAVCSNSAETFDSGVVVWPDWSLALTHRPTLLTFSGFLLFLLGAGGLLAGLRPRIFKTRTPVEGP